MQENEKSNFHVKIEPIIFILLFKIWTYIKSFYYFFVYQNFQGSRKIALKTQLPLVFIILSYYLDPSFIKLIWKF